MATDTNYHPDQLMTEKEAAAILCYSPRALQNWRVRGGGPRYVKVNGNSVRYQMRDLTAWIDARKQKNTAQFS